MMTGWSARAGPVYLRDLVARQVYGPQHVSSADQLGDIFTKALPRAVFLALRPKLLANRGE